MRWENMMQVTMHTGLHPEYPQNMMKKWWMTASSFSAKRTCLSSNLINLVLIIVI